MTTDRALVVLSTGTDRFTPPARSRMARIALFASVASAALCLSAITALADDQSIWTREKLTGDWGGARPSKEKNGVEIGLTYIGETFNILSGGVRRGSTYEGR